MWRCSFCGETFDEPDVYFYVELHGEFSEPWAVNVCPECGSEEIEEYEQEDAYDTI